MIEIKSFEEGKELYVEKSTHSSFSFSSTINNNNTIVINVKDDEGKSIAWFLCSKVHKKIIKKIVKKGNSSKIHNLFANLVNIGRFDYLISNLCIPNDFMKTRKDEDAYTLVLNEIASSLSSIKLNKNKNVKVHWLTDADLTRNFHNYFFESKICYGNSTLWYNLI